MPDIDGHGEGGAERRIVGADHRRQVQAFGLIDGDGRADDPAAVTDDERHLLRRAERSGADEIAFVLTVVVVGDDDEFAASERLDGLGDRLCA